MITGRVFLDWRTSKSTEADRRGELPDPADVPSGVTIVVRVDTRQPFDGTACYLAQHFGHAHIEIWGQDPTTVTQWRTCLLGVAQTRPEPPRLTWVRPGSWSS